MLYSGVLVKERKPHSHTGTFVLTKATIGSISETTNAPALMKGTFPEGDILSAFDLVGT